MPAPSACTPEEIAGLQRDYEKLWDRVYDVLTELSAPTFFSFLSVSGQIAPRVDSLQSVL